MRQPGAAGVPSPPRATEIIRTRYPAGFENDWHAHPRAQLIYPSRGTMTLHTRCGLWVAPPLRACWLPADEPHRVVASAGFDMLSVYCGGPLLKRLPDQCGIVPVSRLLRELILALESPRSARAARHLEALLPEEILLLRGGPLHLPLLVSRRLGPIASALADDPADSRSLGDWASILGTTTRTLTRDFDREAQMTFTAYRRQVRLIAAIERLSTGQPVTAIAADLGFGASSTFIQVFREATGATPGRYFKQRSP